MAEPPRPTKPARRSMSWWRPHPSLRTRMVLIAAAATAVVLMVGGVAFALTLRAVMIDEAMDASRLRARDLGALAAGNALPPFAPIGHDGDLVQVVGAGGQILVSSANIAGRPALDLPRRPPGSTRVISVDGLPMAESGPYRIVAHGIETPSGPATVYVAVSIEEIEEVVVLVGQVGLAAIPIFVLLLSVAMWTVLGRTLAPVETIRQEADEITGRRLDRRVSEPPQYDEIGRLARTVNAMLARLQDSAERQRRFIADTAHELRSPIASLRTQLETARASHRLVEWEDVSADLLDETVRMQQLVEQLLLLARADAVTLGRTRTAVDLDDVVDTVVAGARGRIHTIGSERSPTGGPVRVDKHAVEPVQVTGDGLLLEQLVRNLVDNAVAHATREVRVGLSVQGDQAVLTVDDDGPGVPAERRQEIFERFTRLDGARDRDHGGAGLGLAIVADIVKAHAGVVDVVYSPLGGARFQVRLPVAGAHYGRGSLRKS